MTAAEAAALAAELDDDNATTRPRCEYRVTVVTGDAKGASTDATVTFSAAGTRMDGATAVIREIPLDNAPDNFGEGCTDVFNITAADIGTLTHARIGQNSARNSPGWLLQSVVTSRRRRRLFPQHVWLDKSRGGETHVTLHASQAESEKAQASLLVDKKYVVSVTTADCEAGTDANVWIELVGVSGKSSGARPLDNAMNNFERGKTDRFELDVSGLGAGIERARIGHDNSGFEEALAWCVRRGACAWWRTNRRSRSTCRTRACGWKTSHRTARRRTPARAGRKAHGADRDVQGGGAHGGR